MSHGSISFLESAKATPTIGLWRRSVLGRFRVEADFKIQRVLPLPDTFSHKLPKLRYCWVTPIEGNTRHALTVRRLTFRSATA